MIGDLSQDLRYGLRTLRRSPGFSAMVVLSLALGIGANGAIFSLINAVFLRPLPLRDPGPLVLFSDASPTREGIDSGVPRPGRVGSYARPLYQRLRDQSSFDGVAAQQNFWTTSTIRWAASGSEDSIDRADGRLVTANYFTVLGVPPALGRTFLPEDETVPGGNPVLVLSHGYWKRRFGGNPAIVGGPLTVNGQQYTVVGVAAPDFTGMHVGIPTDFWVPITMQAAFMRDKSILDSRDQRWLIVFGRLKPGMSMVTAEAGANVTLQQYLAEEPAPALADPAARKAIRVGLEPGDKGMSGLRRPFRPPLVALMVGVSLLLLIVCLNVSHLLVARAMQRRREMSIRTALGATRLRLMRQLLAEGLLLALLGGGLGVLVTRWLGDGLVFIISSGNFPIALDVVDSDVRVLSLTAGLALATALLLGLVPAWQASGANLQQALRATSNAITSGGSRRLVSRLLLTSQVAFSLVLLVAAGLLAGSLGRLRDADKGFDSEHVLVIDVNARMAGLTPDQALILYDDLVSRVTALPGVSGASLSLYGLLSGGGVSRLISIPGGPEPTEQDSVQLGVVTPRYFETLGMTLVRGRGLSADDRSKGHRVAVVNEALARRFFGGVEAVGKVFRYDGPDAIEVVGVVRNARTRGLGEEPRPAAYLPVAQSPAFAFLGSMEVRATGEPQLLAGQVRRVLLDSHPELPVLNVRTIRVQMEQWLMPARLLAMLSSAFGLAALFLVCVGLYGVISQWASQRTQEIGVRMALGATAGGVRWMVLRQAFSLVLAGMAIGLPVAIGASRLLKGLLFGVRPMDPTALGLALLALVVVVTVAAYLPARQASRVDPMTALRCQ